MVEIRGRHRHANGESVATSADHASEAPNLSQRQSCLLEVALSHRRFEDVVEAPKDHVTKMLALLAIETEPLAASQIGLRGTDRELEPLCCFGDGKSILGDETE